MIAIICLERGMPSKGDSSDRPDYVPVICTHRPSLLPIGFGTEILGGPGPGFALRLLGFQISSMSQS